MNFTASLIAEFLKGSIEGNPDASVSDISKIEEGKPGTLSFLANPKYEKYIYDTQSSIVIVNADFKATKEISATLVRVENAYESFAALLRLYEQSKPKKSGISKRAAISDSAILGKDLFVGDFTVISENASIGDGVQLYPQVYVGDHVKIGEGTILHPGVKVYEGCVIGANCVIHAGAVIGADGFGFAPNEENNYEKNLGRDIEVLYTDGIKVKGKLESVSDNGIILKVNGDDEEIGFEEIKTAKAIISFN